MEFFCLEDFSPPFITLFNHLFKSVWTHKYLFYILSYNSILCYLSCYSNFFNFGLWELFQVGSCVRLHNILFAFVALSYFLILQDTSGLTCAFPAPGLESAIIQLIFKSCLQNKYNLSNGQNKQNISVDWIKAGSTPLAVPFQTLQSYSCVSIFPFLVFFSSPLNPTCSRSLNSH